MLLVYREHRNKLEDQLAASQMRRLWNSLPDDIVTLQLREYRDKVETNELFTFLFENQLVDCVCVCVCVTTN
jgi:hypothetical protein